MNIQNKFYKKYYTKKISKINDLQYLIRKKIANYQKNSMMATNLNNQIAYSVAIIFFKKINFKWCNNFLFN